MRFTALDKDSNTKCSVLLMINNYYYVIIKCKPIHYFGYSLKIPPCRAKQNVEHMSIIVKMRLGTEKHSIPSGKQNRFYYLNGQNG